jgi:hypothetical protein
VLLQARDGIPLITPTLSYQTSHAGALVLFACLYVAVLLQARDGVTLPSYLTLPPLPGAPKTLLPPNPKPSGPGAQAWDSVAGLKLPLVLFVHGGPWARDGWGLDSTAQWFANRGYAVLQVRQLQLCSCKWW